MCVYCTTRHTAFIGDFIKLSSHLWLKKRPHVFNVAPIQPKEIVSKAAFPWFREWKDKLQDWLACSCPWPRAHSSALQIPSGARAGDAALQMSLYTPTWFRPSNHLCWRAKHLINGSSGFSSGMHCISDGNVWAGGSHMLIVSFCGCDKPADLTYILSPTVGNNIL